MGSNGQTTAAVPPPKKGSKGMDAETVPPRQQDEIGQEISDNSGTANKSQPPYDATRAAAFLRLAGWNEERIADACYAIENSGSYSVSVTLRAQAGDE